MSTLSTSSGSEIETEDELEAAIGSTDVNEYKKGLVRPLVEKKQFTNDVGSLRERLGQLKGSMEDWIERMDVTSSLKTLEKRGGGNDEEEEGVVDPENDFSREMHFLRQAQVSALIGLEKLREIDIPTSRPLDYFAEMVKTDDHMRKVREKLLSKQKRMEAGEKARKMRELKKYGKKVQEEVTDRRRKEKKEMLQSVKRYAKGKGEKPDFLKHRNEEDDFPTQRKFTKNNKDRRHNGPPGVKSRKQQIKDEKYGLGGKKRGIRKNTAESSADMRSFRGRGPFSSGGGAKKKGGTKPRPGKVNRRKMKQRNRN